MSDDDELAALRDAAIDDPEIPEVVRRFLGNGARLDSLRLSDRGVWTFNGRPVEHPRVQALFSRSLRRTDAGTWILSIPPYTYPVLVARTGLFVRRLRDGAAGLEGQLGSGRWVPIDLGTLETDEADYLGVRVDGAAARLVDAAYRDLAADIDADEAGWLVRRGGMDHRVRVLPEGDRLRSANSR